MRWLIRARDVLCILCLILLAFSELYSAAATAPDRFAPSWERMLGWFLFLLPIELIVAVVLVFRGNSSRVGFSLTLLNTLLYTGFMVIDMSARTSTPIGKGDWLALGGWVAFFAVTLLAVYFVAAGPKSREEGSCLGAIAKPSRRG